ncbi:MAG: ferritin family protein [Dehalococcoidales bacterium]|jgi:rubrerythrin|nr:ferritin family protein [Dehalococcoidales bacterium]MDD5605108.1 ferritin family protein [Dehalococcoidales bacterium]
MKGTEAVLHGLELALKMEADGKKYYQQASLNSSNEAGRKLFASLALEEDEHARRFVDIYNQLKKNNHWPEVVVKTAPSQRFHTIFSESLDKINIANIKYDTEIKAVEAAREMEDESISLYTRLNSQAKSAVENDFFKAIIAEEREHSLALNDYAEYLRDPAGWFTVKERHSLDGA